MKLINKLQHPGIQPAALILLAGLLLVCIPHFSHLPAWLNLVIFCLICWRAAYELQLLPIPGKKILFILTIMLLTGILFSYHTLIGRNAGSALLLGLLSLKLFEIKSYRDVTIIINLALFSIVINFLFSQSIPVALTMIAALLFLFTALIGFQHDYKQLSHVQPVPTQVINKNEKFHFKLVTKILIQSVPFAIVIFVLFPRVSGPLWGLPEDAFSGKTGLTDTMSPGRISKLSNDNSVAFRVNFNTDIPEANKLYWRGPVMWNFDGYNWTAPSKERIAQHHFKFSALNKETKYTITLEPHNDYWLFALDIPSVLPERSIYSSDMQVLSRSRVTKLKQYTLTSYTKYILPAINYESLNKYLKLPDTPNRLLKSQELISTLQDADPQKTVNNVLNYFSTQDFYYSRNAPLLFDDPVDEFLFETKRGYCEHYASSFTVLMRLAGIPARVVTGYQGGEINPLDGFMTLRQSDAHAWSEVYLDDKGWVRIDPTAAIPPGNIENTADALRLNSTQKKPAKIFEKSWITKQFQQMRFAWDAVNNRWNQWVLGYNKQQQKALFTAIGIKEISWQGLSQLLFVILGVLTLILSYIIFYKKSSEYNIIDRHYIKFLNKLKKHQLIKQASEGATTFSQRVIDKLPEQKPSVDNITHLYQQLRYQSFDNDRLISFIQQVKNFKV